MKKLAELTQLLDYMEENIDLDHIREIEQLHYDTINYKPIARLPLTICANPEGFDAMPKEEAYDNPEKMLYNEILWSSVHSSYNSVRIKDDGPLMIRADFGKGIIASMFGCKPFIDAEKNQAVMPITKEEAKRTFAKGTPDVKNALGRKVIETYQYYHERLKAYPKCYDAIRITQPDMQEPFDILRLIVGKHITSLLYDDPELTADMISTIARVYVQFRKEIDPLLTDRFHNAIFVQGLCCGGKVLIKSNCAPEDLSGELYARYVEQPDSYILNVFKNQGGGSLQYCGEPKPWHKTLICDGNLRCINYENPEKHALVDHYAYLKDKGVAIVGWGQGFGYDKMRETIISADAGQPIKTGLTLMCRAENWQQGTEILEQHKKESRINRH